MTITVLPAAASEASEAAIWYDNQCSGLGHEFLAELESALDRIRRQPEEFSKLESYPGSHDVRRCLLKRFPYLVLFVRRPGETIVVAISHARRRPLYWIERIR